MTTNYIPERGQTVRLGDIDLYYEEYGEGHPLVLLHGFGGSGRNWYPFVNELSKLHRLIVVDLPGHGHSTNPTNRFTHRDAARDVFLLVDKLGICEFSAMGISSGGMTLLYMATSQPERIDAMVLVSATSYFPEQARVIMRRASFSSMPQPVQRMYRDCARRGKLQIDELISQFNELGDDSEDLNFDAHSLVSITARTLLVHGDQDRFFPVEIRETISCSMPDAKLWIIRGGDHVPTYDPVVPFAERALRFLAFPDSTDEDR